MVRVRLRLRLRLTPPCTPPASPSPGYEAMLPPCNPVHLLVPPSLSKVREHWAHLLGKAARWRMQNAGRRVHNSGECGSSGRN